MCMCVWPRLLKVRMGCAGVHVCMATATHICICIHIGETDYARDKSHNLPLLLTAFTSRRKLQRELGDSFLGTYSRDVNGHLIPVNKQPSTRTGSHTYVAHMYVHLIPVNKQPLTRTGSHTYVVHMYVHLIPEPLASKGMLEVGAGSGGALHVHVHTHTSR